MKYKTSMFDFNNLSSSFFIIFFTTIIISLLTVRCKRDKHEELFYFSIKETPVKEDIPLSLICDNIEYIQIKSDSDTNLIPVSTSIRWSNGVYMIQYSNRIYLIDSQGNNFYTLNKQGAGPGEYSFIMCYDIDKNKNLILSDLGSKKLMFFDFEGNLVRTIKTPRRVDDIRSFGNKRLMLYESASSGNRKYSYSVIDYKSDTLWKEDNMFFFNPNVEMILGGEYLSYKRGSSLYLKEIMNDTLYSLSKELDFKPYAIFDPGPYRWTIEERENYNFGASMPEVRAIISIFETDNYFIYNYYISDKHLNISSKSSGRTRGISDNGFINDIDGGLPFYPTIMVADSFLVQIVDAYKFNAWLESDYFLEFDGNPQLKEQFLELADSLTENDNPVIVKCRIK